MRPRPQPPWQTLAPLPASLIMASAAAAEEVEDTAASGSGAAVVAVCRRPSGVAAEGYLTPLEGAPSAVPITMGTDTIIPIILITITNIR